MPVVQLQDNSGANLGSALGAAAGYFATQKQRKADKQAATTRQADADARLNSAAADKARDTADAIKDRDQTLQIAQGNNDVKTRSAVAYAKYAPMMDTVPKGPDGKALQGPALQNALNQIKNKAIGEGLQGEDLARLMTDAQATMQQNAPKLQDVTHGMQPLKPTDKPEVAVKHWMDAASAVANSDMDPEAKKTAIAMYQKNAADALARVPKPEDAGTVERRREFNLDHSSDGTPKKAPGEGRQQSAQEQYFIQHGYSPPTYSEAHPKEKPPAKTTTPEARGSDYTAAAKAIAKGADRDAVVKRFAAKWQLTPDKVDALFP